MPRLSWNDKLTIEKMLKQGYKAPAIARKLGVHHSTIYDEIKRGAVEILDSELRPITVYAPEMSEAKREESRKNREKPLKIGNDHALAEWLVDMIGTKGYSPSAACALLGKTPETTFSVTLTRQTVYKYIDEGYLWPLTNKQLRYKGSKKRTYKKVKRASRASRAPPGVYQQPGGAWTLGNGLRGGQERQQAHAAGYDRARHPPRDRYTHAGPDRRQRR